MNSHKHHEVLISHVELAAAIDAWQYRPEAQAFPAWVLPFVSFEQERQMTTEGPRVLRFYAGRARLDAYRGMGCSDVLPGDWFVNFEALKLFCESAVQKYSADDFALLFAFARPTPPENIR